MTPSLFSQDIKSAAPLAHRMRPKNLEEYFGQTHLVGPGKLITELLRAPTLPSLILWGPPGSGKTTIASLLAQKKSFTFKSVSAVSVGIKEVKEIIHEASDRLKLYGKKSILFLDEIHRFNKAQQDALLPHVEKGTVILIGATTENPSFEVISALLSRCRVVVLNRLEEGDLRKVLKNALTDKKNGLGELNLTVEEKAENFLIESSNGDARKLLNTLETAVGLKSSNQSDISLSDIECALQHKALTHDKNGEDHYNVISAFIKSMRGSDPDAAIYYLARLLEAGEDPLFVARRMVIFASEDVGNADPNAVSVAISCMQSYDFVGMPEGWIPLAQCATYLATAPKSNTSYTAYKKAKIDVKEFGSLPVPLHLRNAPTKLMKGLGYGKGYQYAHDQKDHVVDHQHLPDAIKNKKYYEPNK